MLGGWCRWGWYKGRRRLCRGRVIGFARRLSHGGRHFGLGRGGHPRGPVVLNADFFAVLGKGVAGEVKLFGAQHLLAPDDDEQLVVGEPQHFIRGQEPAAAKPLRISVLWDDLGQCDALPHRLGGVDLHCHITAAATKKVRRDVIRAAQHELGIGVAQQLRPQVIGVSILDLR